MKEKSINYNPFDDEIEKIADSILGDAGKARPKLSDFIRSQLEETQKDYENKVAWLENAEKLQNENIEIVSKMSNKSDEEKELMTSYSGILLKYSKANAKLSSLYIEEGRELLEKVKEVERAN